MGSLAAKLGRRAERALRFARARFTGNSAILLYHRIASDAWDPFKLCVSPGRFAEQLEVLGDLGTVLGIGEFVRRQREGILEKGSLCLTFDDGYHDFLQNALPALERAGLPAAIYCVSGGLGKPLWWDRLHDSLAAGFNREGGCGLLEVRGGGAISVGDPGSTLKKTFARLYPLFKDFSQEERIEQLDALDRLTRNTPSATSRRLMTEEEIARIAAHPLVTVGAHTVSHSSLTALGDEAQFGEIKHSLETLSEIAGSQVATFSYPYGLRGRDYGPATKAAARRAGLEHALAADPGVVTRRSDPMALPRLWVHDIDASPFERRLQRWL